jgi:hypothetical protein
MIGNLYYIPGSPGFSNAKLNAVRRQGRLSSVTFIRVEIIKFREEPGDILLAEPAVAAARDTVRPYNAGVTPAPDRIDMNMQKAGYILYREHRHYFNFLQHILFPPVP